MTKTQRDEILELCKFNCKTGNNSFDMGAGDEHAKLYPIIQTLLDINQRLSEASKWVLYAMNAEAEEGVADWSKAHSSIQKALAFEAEKLKEILG